MLVISTDTDNCIAMGLFWSCKLGKRLVVFCILQYMCDENYFFYSLSALLYAIAKHMNDYYKTGQLIIHYTSRCGIVITRTTIHMYIHIYIYNSIIYYPQDVWPENITVWAI